MSDQRKDCPPCLGTGNEARMQAVQPRRKILFRRCPDCGASGKVPASADTSKRKAGLRSRPWLSLRTNETMGRNWE
jgi:DnaJ-class molecular chaperone